MARFHDGRNMGEEHAAQKDELRVRVATTKAELAAARREREDALTMRTVRPPSLLLIETILCLFLGTELF